MRSRAAMHTIYHAMDARGVFANNPANADSFDKIEGTPLYTGPQEYPKMLYHPDGEEEIVVQGEVMRDREGFPLLRNGEEVVLGQQKQIIHRIIHSEEEEETLRAEGWHTHPAHALAAAGKEAPPTSSGDRIQQLERELAMLQKQMEAAQAGARLTPKTSKTVDS